MSVDRSLKSASTLVRHRNVLTRAERLAKLTDDGLWQAGENSVFALPKVAHRRSGAGKKKVVAGAEGDAAAAPAAAAPAAKTAAKTAAKPAAKAAAK
jgi:small basic protein (TIGR04137 family)